jgi:nicotinate-nucleotide--dimethylbenzimidazole phosphoribosyltransferase
MSLLDATCADIVDTEEEAARVTQGLLDGKTKPRRSLGRLEDIACRIAAITRCPRPTLPRKVIVIMAGDHGVAQEGISAYPPEVTRQMLLNFARGGAAINVLARQAGARLLVVDMGVRGSDEEIPGVLSRRIKAGTENFTHGPAMTVSDAKSAIEQGIAVSRELADSGIALLGIGEMGIGNTTAASALLAAFLGAPPDTITGHGTGIDEVTRRHKVAIIEKALLMNPPQGRSALEILSALGGFEIAGLAGVVLGAAARRIPVVLDGFIASTAALCAARIAPKAAQYLIASHGSVEVGHKMVLQALCCDPILDMQMRLGEGTGAALAMPIIEGALRILHEMASFEDAHVTDTGR